MQLLLLAQGLEAAGGVLSLLERIQAGGILLLSLVIATICGIAFYKQLKANKELQISAVDKAEAREKAKDEETKTRLTEQEVFLREMLDRERETQEGHVATTQAVEGYTRAMRDAQREAEQTNKLVGTLIRKVESLETAQGQSLSELVRRVDGLESVIRRSRDGAQ